MATNAEELDRRRNGWSRLIADATGNQLAPGVYVDHYLAQLIDPDEMLLLESRPADESRRHQRAGTLNVILRGYVMGLAYADVPDPTLGWSNNSRPDVSLAFKPVVDEPTVWQVRADLEPGSTFCAAESICIQGDGWSMKYPPRERHGESSAAVLIRVRAVAQACVSRRRSD